MEGFSILGLNLPFFVIITLLFSYLIWSKFLNKNKLKINDINNILDIFTIFTFLTVILISIILLFIGIYIIILSTMLRYILLDFIFILPFILLSILICYLTVNGVLFKINFFKEILNKLFVKIMIVCIIFISIAGFLSIPIVKEGKPIYENYEINNPDTYFGEAYLKVKIPIDIKTFGIFNSIAPLIPIRYGYYDISTEGKAGNNFNINLNSTKGIIPLIKSFEGAKTFKDEGFGFSNVIIDESKRLIVLKFDEKNIKNKNIKQIILEGYIKKNMSELDYLYEDNSRYGEVCNEKECNLKININNSLNLPVYQYEDESLILFDYSKIENKSNCKFNEVTYDFNPKNNIRVNPSCDGNSCEIRGWDTNLKKEVFFINLYIDGKVVKSSHIWMNIPINVNANFN